jgi:GNAT superfamily N-acetyltransferase
MATRIEVRATAEAEILPSRERYRRAVNDQIVHDSWQRRGFAKPFVLLVDGVPAGHAAVTVAGKHEAGTIAEFWVEPPARVEAARLFRTLIDAAAARTVRAQTSDTLLLTMLYDFGADIRTDYVLFRDMVTTRHALPGAVFRRTRDADSERMFAHQIVPVGGWLVEIDGIIAATASYYDRYNPPYADIAMEVAPAFRNRGVGKFIVQEVKRVCREAGLTPAARCPPENVASRRTLERAGLLPNGRILSGKLAGH